VIVEEAVVAELIAVPETEAAVATTTTATTALQAHGDSRLTRAIVAGAATSCAGQRVQSGS